MKSQDIVILLKLVCLQHRDHGDVKYNEYAIDSYSSRGLEAALGISKTEVNASINRSISVGMAILDRNAGQPKVNRKALFEFIVYGLKYVFPAKPAEIARGIPTAFSAPGLKGELMGTGDFALVWPDPNGKEKGQSVAPLFKSVPVAVKKDPCLYEYLALVDSIRLGNPREVKKAINMLQKRMDGV